MLQKTRCIVLNVRKYKDNLSIATTYSELMGKTTLLVPLPKSRKSLIKPALFQPLAILEVEADFKDKATMHKIKEAKSVYPFASITSNPYKSAIALFLSEFLYRSIQEEVGNQPLFDYLVHSIMWLDTCGNRFANFHLVFLMRLSRFMGIYPNMENYSPAGYFDLLNGEFSEMKPTAHSYFLTQEESRAVPLMMRMNYRTMHVYQINRNGRMRMLNIINDYYRLHLPEFPELKSLQILKEVFD